MKRIKSSITSVSLIQKVFKRNILNSVYTIAIVTFLITGCKKETENYTLNVSANPNNSARLEVLPDSLKSYKEGTKVYITTHPTLGYYFSKWSGDATGNDDTLSVVMNSNKNIVAEFLEGINESFQDDSADYFINDESNRWSTNDTAYVMTGKGNNTWAYSIYNYVFDNFEVSVDISTTGNTNSSNAMGIYLRSESLNPEVSSYWICLSQSGLWYILFNENGSVEWIQSWTESSDINQEIGKKNNLKVICTGSTIEVLINGVSQGSFTNEQLTSGYVGFMGFDNEGYTNTFIFDNFTLKTISASEKKSTNTMKTQTKTNIKMTGDPRFH